MVNVAEIYGKRLKSDKAVTMFKRYPESPNVETLPAGKPSPKITSFIRQNDRGYYQLDNGNYYIKQSNAVEVVEPESPDESAIGAGLFSGVTDWLGNTGRAASKYSGFLSEGFKESVSDVGSDIFKFSKDIKMLLMLVLGILLFWFLIKLMNSTIID